MRRTAARVIVTTERSLRSRRSAETSKACAPNSRSSRRLSIDAGVSGPLPTLCRVTITLAGIQSTRASSEPGLRRAKFGPTGHSAAGACFPPACLSSYPRTWPNVHIRGGREAAWNDRVGCTADPKRTRRTCASADGAHRTDTADIVMQRLSRRRPGASGQFDRTAFARCLAPQAVVRPSGMTTAMSAS